MCFPLFSLVTTYVYQPPSWFMSRGGGWGHLHLTAPPPPTPQVKFPMLAKVAVASSALWPSSAGLDLGVLFTFALILLFFFFFFCLFATRSFANPLAVIRESTGCNCIQFSAGCCYCGLQKAADVITASRRLRIKPTIGAITFPFSVVVRVQQKWCFLFFSFYNGGLMSFTLRHNSILE